MSETICPDCGERNARGAEFCAACGAFLAWDGAEAEPEPVRSTPSAAPTAPAQQRPSSAAPGPRSTPGPGPAPGPGSAPGPGTAPASPVRREQPRPTAPLADAAGGYAAQATNQVTGQAAAQAWNAATPVVGTQLPGVLGQGARALGAPSTLGGLTQGGSSHGMPWRPDDAQPQQTRQSGYDPQPHYEAPPEPPPPTEGPCPRCGVVNGAELRFCRKCGLALRGPTLHDGGGARPIAPPERLPWWRRWFRPGDNSRRGARAAYRRSLPVRYRIIRWGLALLGIGAIVGAFALIGRNPVGWAVNTWNDVLGKTVQVNELDAYTDPNPAEIAAEPGAANPPSLGATPSPAAPAADTAPNVVDNLSNTAWTTAWSQASQLNPADAACVPPSTPTATGGPESILIVPQNSVNVRAISVAAGLPKDDARRQQQWRPKTLQLAFSDGSCQQVTLADDPDLQSLELNPVDTTQIRLSVVDAYPASPDQPINEVAITDIRIFSRP